MNAKYSMKQLYDEPCFHANDKRVLIEEAIKRHKQAVEDETPLGDLLIYNNETRRLVNVIRTIAAEGVQVIEMHVENLSEDFWIPKTIETHVRLDNKWRKL
jgi:hypothetical protein